MVTLPIGHIADEVAQRRALKVRVQRLAVQVAEVPGAVGHVVAPDVSAVPVLGHGKVQKRPHAGRVCGRRDPQLCDAGLEVRGRDDVPRHLLPRRGLDLGPHSVLRRHLAVREHLPVQRSRVRDDPRHVRPDVVLIDHGGGRFAVADDGLGLERGERRRQAGLVPHADVDDGVR